jgi:LmbE family N-acetylglucosaminyl deacetylase
MTYPLLGHIFSALSAPLHQRSQFLFPPQCPELIPPTKDDRILILAPHPDDETSLAGGYLATAATIGAEINIVIVSNGNAQTQAGERFRELKLALNELGITEFSCLGLPDGRLPEYEHSLHDQLVKILSEFMPNILILPHPADLHSDHAVVGCVGLGASSGMAIRRLAYLDHLPPRLPYPRLYDPKLYTWPPSSVPGNWLSFQLGDSALQQKEAAVRQFQVELSRPILRSHLLATVRRNELFVEFA